MKDLKKGGKSIENIKSKFLAGVLSFTMLSTGCGSTVNNGYSENYNNENNIQDEVIDELDVTESPDELNVSWEVVDPLSSMDVSDKLIENENIKEITQDYIESIKDIKPVYDHEEYFLTKEEVDSIINSASNDVKCSNVIDSDREEAIEKLVDQIYQNSVEFVANNPKYKLKNDTDEKGSIPSGYLGCDEKLGYNLKYFLKSALTSVFENATNDINEDFCLLSETEVIFSSDKPDGVKGEYDNDTNQIYIYYQNTDLLTDPTILDFQEEINQILSHELAHARQHKCNHRSKKNEQATISYNNSTTTLIESSAESAIYNLCEKNTSKKTYDYSYMLQREDEALLFLIGITNPSINGYYNAIFDSNPKALCDYFQLDSDDLEAFYRILYAIDTKDFRTDLSLDMFPEQIANSGELAQILGSDYRVDIFNLSLKNLAKYTSSHPDFSLKDNLTLFNIIKNSLINNMFWLDKDDEGKKIYDNDFLTVLPYLEESYVEFVSKAYNVSIDEIRKIEQINFSCPYDIKDDVNESRLITQFPMLNPILYCVDLPFDGYDDFVQENGITLTKTLTHK